jgi:DNA-binding NarL/FixJ family response regulator
VIHADDPVVRCGIAGFLRHRPEVSVLEGNDPPDGSVLVLCVDEVDDSALAVLRRYWHARAVRVVLVVCRLRESELFDLLECGVAAIVRRAEASPEKIIHAIQMADRGAGDLPPDLLGGLLSHLGSALRSGDGTRDPIPLGRFTGRETEVIRLVAEGFDTREIAEKLSYSDRTVKNVLQSLTLRLGLRNRPHLIAYAAREGYLRLRIAGHPPLLVRRGGRRCLGRGHGAFG